MPFIAHVRTDPMTYVWSIAETVEAADKLARLHLSGAARSPYPFECDCLASWRSQPLPMIFRYHPYRTEIALSPTGLYVLSTSRIGEIKYGIKVGEF